MSADDFVSAGNSLNIVCAELACDGTACNRLTTTCLLDESRVRYAIDSLRSFSSCFSFSFGLALLFRNVHFVNMNKYPFDAYILWRRHCGWNSEPDASTPTHTLHTLRNARTTKNELSTVKYAFIALCNNFSGDVSKTMCLFGFGNGLQCFQWIYFHSRLQNCQAATWLQLSVVYQNDVRVAKMREK